MMWGVDEIMMCVPMRMLVMTKASRQEAFFFEEWRAKEQSAACTFQQKDTQLRRCGTQQQTNK